MHTGAAHPPAFTLLCQCLNPTGPGRGSHGGAGALRELGDGKIEGGEETDKVTASGAERGSCIEFPGH